MEVVLSYVAERDVDLMLVEELSSNPAFFAWFLTSLGISEVATPFSVAHSVTTQNGESDIEISASSHSGELRVLVEDKIDAAFQPGQASRYSKRAEGYRLAKPGLVATTVLVSPEEYFARKTKSIGFEHYISYERILAWYRQSGLGDRRVFFKTRLLQLAIDRFGTGWISQPCLQTTKFWRDYWTLASRLAPELKMPRPSNKPAISSFVLFRPSGLGRGVELIHKATYGHVDLQFAGYASRLDELEGTYGKNLGKNAYIDKANKSGVLRIDVPEINMEIPSTTNIRKGIRAAQQLMRVYAAGSRPKGAT